MGLTTLEYTVSPEGYPRDVVAIESTSWNFTKASLKALSLSLYQPSMDQKAVYGRRHRYTFQLENRNGKDIEVQTRALKQKLSKLEAAAEGGDAIAQYQYGSKLNVFRSFKSFLHDVDLEYRTANEWFTKSAKSGLPNAQFEIGRNMLEGRGCEVDEVSGYKWINAAALGGYSPAQRLLAQTALSEAAESENKAMAATNWLRNAALSNNYPAKLMLAWELSTSSSLEVRDGHEALNILEEKPKGYFDELRIHETKAAAYAETGEFKKAIKYQKKALKLAQKSDWDIALVRDRLGLYEHKEPYRGSYY